MVTRMTLPDANRQGVHAAICAALEPPSKPRVRLISSRNHPPHKTPGQALRKHPRFNCIHPNHGSIGLNLVERFSPEITPKRIRRQLYQRRDDPGDHDLRNYLAKHTQSQSPFTLDQNGEDILSGKTTARGNKLEKSEPVKSDRHQ